VPLVALLARPSLRGVPPPPLPPPTPLLLLLTSLVLRMSGLLLLLVGSAAAARARVAGVVAVAAGVVVEAAVEVVEAAAVVAAVGVVAGVGALVAAVVVAVGVAVVAAVGVVAVRVELFRREVLEMARGSSSSVGARPLRPRSLVSGLLIVGRLGGDCYWCVPPDPGIEAAALGASESALPGTAPAEALHTFTHESGASRFFFCDYTTLTPLSAPVPVRLADPSGGPVLAHSSTVLLCPAVLSGSLSCLHLPSFSTNVVSTAALQDVMVTTTTPGGQRVSICTCTRMGHHLATFTRQVRSLPPLPPSPAPPCLPCVEGRQRAAPYSSSFPPKTAPLKTLHMDVGSEFSSDLLQDFCHGKGILQFTLPASPQQNGIVEHRIGLVMEVARTSVIHAAAPHFLWPFAVRYAAHQLNLWPRVSLPKTLPTVRWTGKVGDVSVFRVCGSRAIVCNTSADKLSARAIAYVFLGFPPDTPGWLFHHPTSRSVLPSQDVTFDESVPFYCLFPYRSAHLPPLPLFLAPGVVRGATSGGATSRVVASRGAEPASAEPGGAEPRGADATGEGIPPGSAPPDSAPSDSGPPGSSPAGSAPPSSALACSAPPNAAPLTAPESTASPVAAISRPALHVCAGRRVPRPRPPPVPGTNVMALRPSSVPLRAPLPPPPESSLLVVLVPESDLAHALSPTVPRLLATIVTDPSFASTAACALVAELVDFAAVCRLDYASALVAVSDSACPPSGRVDFFQTFSPTLKMTTPRVLLHVAAPCDYELHSLDFSRAVLQGSLHEEIWLRRPHGFTASFPVGTQWSLRQPVYSLHQVPREWHDTLRTTLVALGFAPSTVDPSLFLRTDTSLPPFYVLVYVDDLVFSPADTPALTWVLQRFNFRFSSPQSTPLPTGHSHSAQPSDDSIETSGPYPELVGCLMVLRYLCSTSGMGLVLRGRGLVVLTEHADASWVDDLATQGSSQGYTFSLGSGSVSWRSSCSSSVLSSSCEAEIYAVAMAAQELC
ncbi:unnamed protein product, partial [Closterium sp. NIES-54]